MTRLAVLISCLALNAVKAEEPTQITPMQREFFEKSVRPVLATHCYKCHSAKKQEGMLRLDSRSSMLKGGQTGPAITPGKPEDSELVLAINYDPSGYQMPPTGKLTPDQIAALTKWIKMGAPWPDETNPITNPSSVKEFNLAERAKHWSFQPVNRAGIPMVGQPQWPRNAIDNFILAKLEAAKLQPAAETDRRTWLRRATYDLTGLPPTAHEVQQFLEDESPTAYEKVVNRLLASPAYGERWARHWLDLVRFAETAGHEFDYEIEHAWPYRDYVVRAWNADVPYDQFVREHIAGDLLAKPRRHPVDGINESILGTGFYWFGQGKHSPVDILAEECDCIDNQIDVLGKTFMGLTIACARCHDHKFDPITANDYYAMSGYLQSSRRQHAFINPAEPIQQIIPRLTKLHQQQSRLMSGVVERQLGSSMEKLDQVLTALTPQARKDRQHPFHAWAVLSGIRDPAKFNAAKTNLAEHLSDLTNQQNPAETFADFSPSSMKQWLKTGQAFDQGSTPPGCLSETSNHYELLPPDTAHSGANSARLQGVIRSPTFTIEKRFIHYRMHRVGGRANPGRANKNGQVHLIVDGFQFIKNPLYGQLSLNVKQEDNFRWYRQDLAKFQGKNAYIEIQDEDDGSIIIDRVVFSDAGAPPEPPNQLVLALLNDPKITTSAELKAGYQSLLETSLKEWQSGQWEKPQTSRDQVQLLNGVLSQLSSQDSFTQEETQTLARLKQQIETLEKTIPKPQRAIAMTDGTGENAPLLIRGNPHKAGQQVPRRFLEVFGDQETDQELRGSGRLGLAHRVASSQNPLTARVLVNRLWLHHFGRGIVATPDDFGKMGQIPTHPELLDWLAGEFIQSGWSIKSMHRLMVLSSTYRMSSHRDEGASTDPDNRLLHRMPVKRLEGEAIRDAVLYLSGRLNSKMEGPSVLPHLTPFMEGRGRPKRSGPLDGEGRRSLYINVRRNFLTPMFLAFDFPTPFTTMGRRSASNVPAQALTMMNNPFILQQTKVWAERVLAEVHASPQSRITRLYEMAFTRSPSDAELQSALAFLDAQGQDYTGPDDPRTWADLCHVLLNVKEFIFIN